MNNLVYFDVNTNKVLNEEVTKAFKNPNEAVLSGVGIVDRKYVQIENGYIVKRYTQAEMEQRQDIITEIKRDIFFESLNERSKARREEQELERVNAQSKKHISRPPVKTKDQINRERARKNSATARPQSVKRTRSIKKKIDHAKVIAVAVAILGLTATIGYGANTLKDNIAYTISHNTVNTATATLLDKTPDDRYRPNIVSLNTERNNHSQVFWYDNIGIGQDLLKLPDETFDTNLYLIYSLMGSNASNAYNNNFDEVIAYVGRAANPETNPIAYSKCNGCNSLDEYLVKNGIVDDKGAPSLENFKRHGRASTISNADYLENIADEYRDEYIASKGGR